MAHIDVVVHLHEHGTTVYGCRLISTTGLLDDEAYAELLAKALGINYEPNKGESLFITSLDLSKIPEVDFLKLAAENAP